MPKLINSKNSNSSVKKWHRYKLIRRQDGVVYAVPHSFGAAYIGQTLVDASSRGYTSMVRYRKSPLWYIWQLVCMIADVLLNLAGQELSVGILIASQIREPMLSVGRWPM